MRLRVVCSLIVFALLGTAPSRSDGVLLRVYATTDEALVRGADTAAMLKGMFLQADDTAWAAYYTGREAVYREQLAELGRTSLPPFILRPQ